jgi:gas vesicle protein
MDNEELIREQMADTRTALTEKLESLEDKVTSAVETAAADVVETVAAVTGSVQESVANVRESVQETIGAVKDSVKEGVNAFQDAFNLPAHFQRHPWLMLAGSMGVGYCAASLLQAAAKKPREQSQRSGDGVAASPRPYKNGRSESVPAEKPAAEGLLDKFSPELEKLKGLAIGTLMGTLREIVAPALPGHLSQSVIEIIDSATEKLGGKPVPHVADNEGGTPEETEEKQKKPFEYGSRWASAT